MRFAAYPKYKPSGVESLGDVPEQWNVKRGRFCMNVNPRSRQLRTLDPEDEVSFVPMEAVGEYGGLQLEQTRMIVDVGTGYTEFDDGDVVVAKITPCFENGKGALAAELVNGAAFGTTELHVLRPATHLERRFLFYFTISRLFRSTGEGEMYGAGGQKRVPPAFCKDVRVPLPPLDDQRSIADFLDRGTAKIDALVAKKRTLIERLKEKRTALISRTVTRGLPPDAARATGLDPHPKLKPSGIAALGDVPVGWRVKKLKCLASDVRGSGIQIGPFGGMLTELSYDAEGDYKVYGQENTLSGDFASGERWITHEQYLAMSNYHIAPGDVLFTRKGSIGGCSVIPFGVKPGIIDSDTIRLRVDMSAVDTTFVLYSFKFSSYLQGQVQEVKRGAILSGLNSSTIGNLNFAIPSLQEQRAITAFLDSEMGIIDGLLAKIETAIERLQEYRTALITAAVTGKIDLRETVA